MDEPDIKKLKEAAPEMSEALGEACAMICGNGTLTESCDGCILGVYFKALKKARGEE